MITIKTSDIPGAATSATLHLQLQGVTGVTPWVTLPSRPGDFNRGQEASFRVLLPDVAPLEMVLMELHGGKPGERWHLESIEVVNEYTGNRPCPFCLLEPIKVVNGSTAVRKENTSIKVFNEYTADVVPNLACAEVLYECRLPIQ
jgi:hypothetical protein